MFCLALTVCMYSNDVNHRHIPVKHGMSKPYCIVNNTMWMHWTDHDAHVSTHINDIATIPIVTSWIDYNNLTFFIQLQPHNFSSKFPCEWFISWFNWQWTVWFHIFSIWWADRDKRLWNAISRLGSQDCIWADGERILSGIGPCKCEESGHEWVFMVLA